MKVMQQTLHLIQPCFAQTHFFSHNRVLATYGCLRPWLSGRDQTSLLILLSLCHLEGYLAVTAVRFS
jgi:hypothetical protein